MDDIVAQTYPILHISPTFICQSNHMSICPSQCQLVTYMIVCLYTFSLRVYYGHFVQLTLNDQPFVQLNFQKGRHSPKSRQFISWSPSRDILDIHVYIWTCHYDIHNIHTNYLLKTTNKLNKERNCHNISHYMYMFCTYVMKYNI